MFNANASSGGFDIIGKVINKYTHIELGSSIAVVGAHCCQLHSGL